MANPGDSGFVSATAASLGVAVSPFVDGAVLPETFHPSVQRSPFATDAPAAEVVVEPAVEVTEPAPVEQAFSEVVSIEPPVIETVPVVAAPTDTEASPFVPAQEVTPPTA